MQKIHILRQAGIPVMLLKGLAFRFYYDIGVPRVMYDFDIAVPETCFEKAIQLIQDEESENLGRTAPHHAVIRGEHFELEVHCWIFKNHGEKDTDIWERAVHFDFNGEDVCVLCPIDMFIHQLDNRSRDYFSNTFSKRWVKVFYDLLKLMEYIDPFDEDIIFARAKQIRVENSTRHVLSRFAKYFPDKISKKKIDELFPITPEYKKWFRIGIEFRQELIRFRAYRYNSESLLTPSHIWRGLRIHIKRFRYWHYEYKLVGEHYSVQMYCRDIFKIESFKDLFSRYISRLRLIG